MKLGLSFFCFIGLACAVQIGCGSDDNGRERACENTANCSVSSTLSDAGVAASDGGSDAGKGTNSSGTNGGTGTSASGGGVAVCGPDNSCNGLWECNDPCYGADCCSLNCTCSDSSGLNGNLECSLQCSK